MQVIHVWFALAGVILILSGACVYLGLKVLKARQAHEAHVAERKKNMLDDLELATSDQLLQELRKRPGCPYLMLCPLEGEDHKGISIEIHNIPPVPCLQMLHIATALTFRELKSRGVEVPDMMPPFGEPPGESWASGE